MLQAVNVVLGAILGVAQVRRFAPADAAVVGEAALALPLLHGPRATSKAAPESLALAKRHRLLTMAGQPV